LKSSQSSFEGGRTSADQEPTDPLRGLGYGYPFGARGNHTVSDDPGSRPPMGALRFIVIGAAILEVGSAIMLALLDG
jgi:hypothetical protein